MYRVLIAEDEKLVRIGLKNSVDWGRFGMAVVADEPDGEKALAAYERERPEVVITDIRMPRMDGMELISRIRERDRDTRFIILTCLEEFALIRSAMNLNVSGYIIKVSMTDEEIEAALRKVRDELDAMKCAGAESPVIRSNIGLIREKVFRDFVLYRSTDEEEFARQIAGLGTRLRPGRHAVCAMGADRIRRLAAGAGDGRGELVRRSVASIVDGVLGERGLGEAFACRENRYLLVINLEDGAVEAAAHALALPALEAIRRSLEKYFNISVSFGVSAACDGYGALRPMSTQAEEALARTFYLGPGVHFFTDAFAPSADGLREKAAALRGLPERTGESDDAFRKKYGTRVGAFIRNLPAGETEIRESCRELLQWMALSLRAPGGPAAGYAAAAEECETFDELLALVRDFYAQRCAPSQRRGALSEEVSQAVEYIGANFDRSISLMQVAAYVNLSANYLSALIKRELGVNFVDYVDALRMEKAGELLLGTGLKSFEVAEKLGFSDNTYFSKAFKRHYGINPSEYRKHWGRDWAEDACDEKRSREKERH